MFLKRILTHKNVQFQLKNQYKQANDTLTSKSASSEVARERAQQLLQRASRITVDTTNKLKELRGKQRLCKYLEYFPDSTCYFRNGDSGNFE